ncbi:MAG: hypothetical protein WA478_22030, partial [Pseudolabrys sp.]
GVTVGAALVGVATGHPIQVVKETEKNAGGQKICRSRSGMTNSTGGRVIEDAAAVVEWIGGWF